MVEQHRSGYEQIGGIREIIYHHIVGFSDTRHPFSLKNSALAKKADIRRDISSKFPYPEADELVKATIRTKSIPINHYLDALHSYDGFLINNLIPLISESIDLERLQDNLDNFINWELYYHIFPIFLENRINQERQKLKDVNNDTSETPIKPRNKSAIIDHINNNIVEFTDAIDVFNSIVKPTIDAALKQNHNGSNK